MTLIMALPVEYYDFKSYLEVESYKDLKYYLMSLESY